MNNRKTKIAIDTTMMDGRTAKGTAIVIRKHIEGLLNYRDEFDFTLVHKFAQPNDPLYKEFNEIIIPRIWNGPFGGVINEFLFFLSTKNKFDIYFICYSRLLPSFIFAPAKYFMFYPMDGGPTTSSFNKVKTKTPFPKYVLFFKNKIHKFLALTEFGRRGIMQIADLPIEKVPVVNGGVEKIYKPVENISETKKMLLEKYSVPEKYILCVSRWDPHKNILNLLEAYKIYKSKTLFYYPLVFVGGKHMPDYSKVVEDKLIELGLSNDIIVTPFIPTETMPAIYGCAEFFIFPSFYEGFGLPAIEAFASGCPAVLSTIDALREVGGEAAIYFDPNNIEEMSEQIIKMHNQKDLREQCVQKGLLQAKKFTWEKATLQLVEIFRSFKV